MVRAIDVTNARFEEFKVMHSHSNSAGFYVSGGNVLINNNWVTGNAGGVLIASESSAIVRNNIVEGNGVAGRVLNYGVICLRATPYVANNWIVSNAGVGTIPTTTYGATAGRTTMRSRVAYPLPGLVTFPMIPCLTIRDK